MFIREPNTKGNRVPICNPSRVQTDTVAKECSHLVYFSQFLIGLERGKNSQM
jgi:hypothetical protein